MLATDLNVTVRDFETFALKFSLESLTKSVIDLFELHCSNSVVQFVRQNRFTVPLVLNS